MLHLLFDRRPWFRPKRYGYGAGLPIDWRGWLLVALHVALIVGVTQLLGDKPLVLTVVIFLVVLLPLPVYIAKTEGGWHWRWGEKGDRK